MGRTRLGSAGIRAGVVVGLALVGCGVVQAVRSQFGDDFGCEDRVAVVREGDGDFVAFGCEKIAAYRCSVGGSGRTCTRIEYVPPQPTVAAAVDSGGATAEEDTAPVIKRGKVRAGRAVPPGGSGRMTGSVFTERLSQKRGAIEACYNNALAVNPRLAGDVTFVVTVDLQGAVTVETEESTPELAAAGVTACIVRRLETLDFSDTPPEGGDVRVRVPITFISPGGHRGADDADGSEPVRP